MRLIDADALLNEWEENPPAYDMDSVVNSVKNFPTERCWISVNDHMLNPGELVICIVKHKTGERRYSLRRSDEGNTLDWHGLLEPVTHWMQIPDMPKEDADEH